MQSDTTVPNNKQDIMMRHNETGTCLLIETAIPRNEHMTKIEAKKILRYTDLTTEIPRMWNVKANAMPVTTVTISQSYRQYLSNKPGKHEIKGLHKTVILGTAHVLR
jgi:hypothetical protein